MVVTRTVVVTVVMNFPVTNCLVSVTRVVILDTQTLTAARVCYYKQKHIKHLRCLMISRLTLQLIRAMINMLRNQQFIGIDDICCFLIQNVHPCILDWIVKNVVVAIVKTMDIVTMSVECVLMDVWMGLWTNIVIAVRNIHDHFTMIFYTFAFFFILNLNVLWIIACKAGWYGQNCTVQCPPNCNGTCEPIDGTCVDCKEGSKNYCSIGNYRYTLKNLFLYIFIYRNENA